MIKKCNIFLIISGRLEKVEEALKLAKVNKDPKLKVEERPLVEAEQVYPCLLAMCGSAFFLFNVRTILHCMPL